MQKIEKLTYLIEGLGSIRSNSNGLAPRETGRGRQETLF